MHILTEKLRSNARRTISTAALRCSLFSQKESPQNLFCGVKTALFFESPVGMTLAGKRVHI